MDNSVQSAENFSLADMMKLTDRPMVERIAFFNQYSAEVYAKQEILYRRKIIRNNGRLVVVEDPYSHKHQKMLMFGSNNYLGIANHPEVSQRTAELTKDVGLGLGGPPLLNGHSWLHHDLEKKLAKLKNKEDSMIFSSGFLTNFGLGATLFNRKSVVIFDEYSHASFIDGMIMARTRFKSFKHNDIEDLKKCLTEVSAKYHDIFVATEGVFSMDGDIGILDQIIELKNEFSFILIADDAHGLGVIGENGHGVHEHFHTDGIDIIMGTFSKTLAATGGFIAASSEIINYMRFMCRTYMFSAALPPAVIAMVLAGLEIIEKEPWRTKKLKENTANLIGQLNKAGIKTHSESAIVTIMIPENIQIRKLCKSIHDKGIFLNAVEYPAVPVELQRLRISLMADHTEADITKLVGILTECFQEQMRG